MESVDQPRTTSSRPYHHGDLRNAVIEAALSLLKERGVEGVTLRQCAARAGVSHGAPGHHFGDLKGVLTAIAALGFEGQVAHQEAALAGRTDPVERLAAIGGAYVGFAVTHPAHFSLMFRRDRLRTDDPAFVAASGRAGEILLEETYRYIGDHPHARQFRDMVWSIVHGYASLLISGQKKPPENPEAAAFQMQLAFLRGFDPDTLG
ncbi:TetR/AcrR family transcriptional regulator [Parvularcula marina]|uniref:TetR/AcrR family transcriptional regulator n=1 Tax=Parvularcula marina TaxID=2292771 RepID=A0A371RHU0_9PROT|nr:WHG domain-containing protein [Parvularcula marina]RFB05002.1 TetR/AcrR family transcriptional regulator [Parvularcula marina]